MAESRKRSAAFLSASRHWSSKKSEPELKNTEDTDNDDVVITKVVPLTQSDNSTPINKKQKLATSIRKASPIKLLLNPSYDDEVEAIVNKDTILIEDLLGASDLDETFQFNFTVDLPMFLRYLNPKFQRNGKKITFVTGSVLLDPSDPDTLIFKNQFNISEVTAAIPNRFGTHHTKMMVNFFEDKSCEIVIMSFNLNKIDVVGLTQTLWRSGRLQLETEDSVKLERGENFKRDFMNYLKKYNSPVVTSLADRLQSYDFHSIDVELLASAPGKYEITNLTDKDEVYGYGKLYQILKRNNLLVDNTKGDKLYNFLSQVTSISYPFNVRGSQTASVFSHLLAPLVFSGGSNGFKILLPGSDSTSKHQKDNYYLPHMVYPTVKEIANNNVGFGAGQAVHMKHTKSDTHRYQYQQNIRPYLRKWNSSGSDIVTGRELVVPHCKYFMCDNGDNFSSLKWALVGSHNLSKQAWGSPVPKSTNPNKYEISSFELGVVVFPKEGEKLVPAYGEDTVNDDKAIPLRMPFSLPPTKYTAQDEPWSEWVSYGELKDKFGQTYNLSK